MKSLPPTKGLLHSHSSLCGLCCSVPVQLLTGKDMVSSGMGRMHSLSLPTERDTAIMRATRPAGNVICTHT